MTTRIMVFGAPARINGKPVIFANTVAEVVHVNNDRQTQSRSQNSQGEWREQDQRRSARSQSTSDRQNRRDNQGSRSSSQTRSGAQGSATIYGTIEDYRKVDLRARQSGESRQHTFVKLRLEDGRSLIVDLGSDVDMADLELSRDDRIMIQGQRDSLGGREVIRARRIRVDGETTTVSSRR